MQVFVTPQAERNFDSIVDDINDKWGERTARQFIKKADEIFKLLKNYPSMGQIEKDDIRGFSAITSDKDTLPSKGRKDYYSGIF